MPTLDIADGRLSSKSLLRSQSRSATSYAWHKATYHKEVLPRIRKLAMSFWRDAIKTQDPGLRLALSKEYRELSEMRRQLLGFPGPGKRRDESDNERSAKAQPSVIELVASEEQKPLDNASVQS